MLLFWLCHISLNLYVPCSFALVSAHRKKQPPLPVFMDWLQQGKIFASYPGSSFWEPLKPSLWILRHHSSPSFLGEKTWVFCCCVVCLFSACKSQNYWTLKKLRIWVIDIKGLFWKRCVFSSSIVSYEPPLVPSSLFLVGFC